MLCDYLNQYDIIALQETWAKPLSNFALNGYVYFNFPRKLCNRKCKRSSGGIGVFVKQIYESGIKIVNNFHEYIVWLELDTSVTVLDKPLYFSIVYFPPENSVCSIEHDLYGILSSNIVHFSSKGYVLICGDLNARTGMLNDIEKQHAGKDLFLDNVNQCMHNLNNFRYNCDFRNCDLIRTSKDKVVNRYGRELIALCKTNT